MLLLTSKPWLKVKAKKKREGGGEGVKYEPR